jgi:hypothetical protein
LVTSELGPRGREGREAHGRGKLAPTAWPHWATSERERERRARGGLVLTGARARAAGLVWARMAFSFFLIAFLFLFSRVFNPNSIQVSNSN